VIACDGHALTLSAKFLEEISQFARLWPGVVRLVAYEDTGWNTPFSIVTVEVASLPFELEIRSHDQLDKHVLPDGPAVVLSAIGDRYDGMVDIGRHAGVPVVYVGEYTYRTSLRMMQLETPNPVRRLRRAVWLRRHDRRERRSVSRAAGLQCNGTPTFDAYRGLNKETMLYFNSRVTDDLLARPEEQSDRSARLRDRSHPLHLLFSGRIERVKGADLLPELALELRARGVPFRLSICGGGSLVPVITRRVDELGLADVVKVRSPMRFADELMPFVRREVDLFVCCHPQGDPSCTYVETMACGVPYVGFTNEALDGVAHASRAAWVTPAGSLHALVDKIAELDRDREALVNASERALEFARRHTFEIETAQRVQHLRAIAGL
jgi:glycosyltransferase involved in cell wall biosynthesis